MVRKTRIQTPPQFKEYKEYKPFLRREFDYCCAYCVVTEAELGGSKSFHIDHYCPKSKFPNKSAIYANLFYTCRDCNTYKGNYWPSLWQAFLGMFIINPCDHDPDSILTSQKLFGMDYLKQVNGIL